MSGTSKMNRETLFCHYCATLGNPKEAAVRAGFPAQKAEESAARLLAQKNIRSQIDRFSRRDHDKKLGELALLGLARLALGEINDAIRLMSGDELPAPDDLMKLNLFSVAEIKRPKGGGLEIKFFDRLKPLELLLEYAGKKNRDRAGAFYKALMDNARQAPAHQEDDDAL